MKKVRFSSTDPHQKEFSIAVRRNVNNYFKRKGISAKGNAALVVKTIVMLILYLAPFIMMLLIPVPAWAALGLVVLMGIGEAGIGMSVMHDAAHGAFSEKKWVNSLFSSTMFLLGSNTFNWKIQHNILHHSFTNIYGYDQDIETKATIRLCQNARLKNYHRLQHIYSFPLYGLMTLSKLVTDLGQLMEFNREGVTREMGRNPRAEVIKLLATKFIYLSLIIGLPLLFTGFSWWQVLIGFAVLHVTAGMIMSTIFQMAHVVEGTEQPLPNKEGIIENEWAVHELRTTSDFARSNRLLNWYAGGLNFQIEHHLFTHICHVHYHKIAPIVEQTAREYGIPYNLKPSFVSALRSHIRRLKALGRPHLQ